MTFLHNYIKKLFNPFSLNINVSSYMVNEKKTFENSLINSFHLNSTICSVKLSTKLGRKGLCTHPIMRMKQYEIMYMLIYLLKKSSCKPLNILFSN